ncbi:uncharacterized protein LOC143536349 [Bidens hawaiensis]|uniref:uncharacterized protein LOC143536349 n=1 Tax=Bidens hawaiensis TaxID=980011 RepID=UPI00404A6478
MGGPYVTQLAISLGHGDLVDAWPIASIPPRPLDRGRCTGMHIVHSSDGPNGPYNGLVAGVGTRAPYVPVPLVQPPPLAAAEVKIVDQPVDKGMRRGRRGCECGWACFLIRTHMSRRHSTFHLYTTSTVILVLQSLYYDHIYAWLKSGKTDAGSPEVEEVKKPLKQKFIGSQNRAIRPTASYRRDYYFTSARSLAASSTPPNRACPWTTRSGPASAMAVDDDESSEDESSVRVPKIKIASQPKPIPRSVSYGSFLATSLYMPSHAKGLVQVHAYRKFMQDNSGSHTAYGQWLGWLMAAIYMGGRIPQIILNIKRGCVEGLNPLMFIFALVANATYAGSILVRSTEWERIRAKMPWLLDAAVCVALDAFIITQYVYYRYFLKRVPNSDDVDYHCDY